MVFQTHYFKVVRTSKSGKQYDHGDYGVEQTACWFADRVKEQHPDEDVRVTRIEMDATKQR